MCRVLGQTPGTGSRTAPCPVGPVGKRPQATLRSWEFPVEAFEKAKNKWRKLQQLKPPQQTGRPAIAGPVENACQLRGQGQRADP